MLLISHATVRTMTPDDPQMGLARVAVSMVLRMAAAFAALLCYYVWIRPGLVPFGIGLIAGFIVMIAVEMFRLGRRSVPSVR